MKKNILVLLVVFFGFSNVALSAACSTADSGTSTTMELGNGSWCSVEPNYYAVTVYDMRLCLSEPIAPTSSSKIDLSSCQTVFSSSVGSLVKINNGSSSSLIGSITRPNNGSYQYGYLSIKKEFVIGDSREYTLAAKDGNGGSGKYCATTSTASIAQCSSTPITLTTSDYATEALNDFGGDSYVETLTVDSDTIKVYLVGANEHLSTSDDNNGYLLGVQTFSTPVVITDDTGSMDTAFKVSTGMNIDTDDAATPPLLHLFTGAFSTKITVQ
jgi:hypothetical protein